MHTSYTVGITTGEYLALRSVMVDPEEWVNNAIKNRARIASVDIINEYTQFKINKGEAITSIGSTAVIQDYYNEGVTVVAELKFQNQKTP